MQLRQASFDAIRLRLVGFDIAQLRQMDFETTQLFEAVSGARRLHQAGLGLA